MAFLALIMLRVTVHWDKDSKIGSEDCDHHAFLKSIINNLMIWIPQLYTEAIW